ncbi:MAG: VOC family protein, partial [Ilumatobacteraceae bacterium]
MAVSLNHTIVGARDKHESARFLSEILGLAEPRSYGHFVVVELDHGLSLDFDDVDGEVTPQHYAFLIDEATFDGVYE